jgi:hypothetical protein
MAITITFDHPNAEKISKDTNLALISGTIKTTSYTTGGIDLTTLAAKFKDVYRVICDNKLGYLCEYVSATNLLLVYRTVDGTAGTRSEVANAADISAAVFSYIAYGKR